jgi:hypothetical protein
MGKNGMNCNPWEVWAADVKFEDSPEVKRRPVLILENKQIYAVCLKMTGTEPRCGEYALSNWTSVGLKKQTTVRIGKVLHMTQSDLKYKIGDLSPLDIANIQSILLNGRKQ